MTAWLSTLLSWLKLLRLRGTGAPLLIVERPGGIGDLLCVLPAAFALKARHPGARLVFFTARAFIPLVELSGVADCVIAAETRGLSKLRKWLRPLIDVYPLLPDEQTPRKPRSRIHLIHEFAKILGIGISELVSIQLVPNAQDVHSVAARLLALGIQPDSLVVVHSGPTWPVKQWPTEHWGELTRRLHDRTNLRVIQIGLDAHAGSKGVSIPRIPGSIDWTGRLSLPETLALISLSTLFIGVDSGPLHLAGYTDTAVIGLFGPTDPKCILPIRHSMAGMAEPLPCIGCHHDTEGHQHWRTDCPRHVQCMVDLSVESVFQQCLMLIP